MSESTKMTGAVSHIKSLAPGMCTLRRLQRGASSVGTFFRRAIPFFFVVFPSSKQNFTPFFVTLLALFCPVNQELDHCLWDNFFCLSKCKLTSFASYDMSWVTALGLFSLLPAEALNFAQIRLRDSSK